MPDILVTENIAGAEMDKLRNGFDVAYEPALWKTPERLFESIRNVRALIVRNQTRVTSELISAGKNLQVIARAGVGLDNIDAPAATTAGIVVVYAPEQNSISVAELTIGLILSLARMIPPADRSTRSGQWDRQKFTGIELYNKTLGIVGIGRIGFLTAMRAKAFGMEILAHDSFINPDSPLVAESRARLVTLDELLAQSDFISCHLPETPQTLGLF